MILNVHMRNIRASNYVRKAVQFPGEIDKFSIILRDYIAIPPEMDKSSRQKSRRT